MNRGYQQSPPLLGCGSLFILIVMSFAINLNSQTASTGALIGLVLDPSGVIVSGATIHLTAKNSPEVRSASTDENGWFGFISLPPGGYDLEIDKPTFKSLRLPDLHVDVTETIRLDLHLSLPTRVEQVHVSSEPLIVQRGTSALGNTVSRQAINGLPLVTRNFVQIAGLSPGVSAGVYNAGELGSGGTALSQVGPSNDGIFVHGSRSYANNWQLDGVSVSDILGSGSASGGIPTPNPDSLEEFKVQTGQYDAAFGRTAGADVSVITKTGTNRYHGTVFEFLRNDVFNANEFFLNRTGQRRPTLKQNQFGFTFGGPIQKDKLLFFGSYQGTRQINGLAAGQARIGCAVSVNEPPITDDRSPAALGQLFSGMTGAKGGVAITSDGSNINPVALSLLNFKLPDGRFLIPTPQTVDTLRPFASRGFSALTEPCDFREDQGLGNLDYVLSQKSRLTTRLFVSDGDQLVTFPANGPNPTANTRGFKSPGKSEFIVLSLAHVYASSNTLLNEVRLGFARTRTKSGAEAPFKWSDVGVSEGDMNRNNELPTLNILGSVSMATAFPRTYTQNTASLSDIVSLLYGAHSMRVGGSLTRLAEYFDIPGLASSVQFLSWPDFLLGLDASQNGTEKYSNVFASTDFFGFFNRDCAGWEGSLFTQDDYRIRQTLTLNLGLRYERLGHLGDKLGRNSSFDISKANANPPPDGSLDGYIVSSNFPASLPRGVIRTSNSFGIYGEGQNTIAPRIGFAWQTLPSTHRFVLRGGYGLYYSRPTGQASTQSILGAPFSMTRMSTGSANAGATFQAPFAQPFPTPASFPMFVPYSQMTKSSVNTLAPNFIPAMAQQSSLNAQVELHDGWVLEVGYVGTRGIHLQRKRSQNQALNATPEHPIRGVTLNTLDNIGLRVPIPGILPDSLREMESEGSSWYNGLEASLAKRLDHGLQLLASYTFSKTLDTDGAEINGTSAGNTLPLGDQNSPRQRWGRASFDRTHRFIVNTTWALPSPHNGVSRAVLGGWFLAAIVTIQSGSALSIADTNSNNVFGISEDRAQLSRTCSKSQLVKSGSIESKLNGYFNTYCFTTPPIIGADGIGTGFGNSATGIVDGPGQANLDLAASKSITVGWPHDGSALELRAELFNAFNHPQFANPDSNFTSPTFGIISSTSVSARVGQLALKFAF
jgi:hypothetical protein